MVIAERMFFDRRSHPVALPKVGYRYRSFSEPWITQTKDFPCVLTLRHACRNIFQSLPKDL